MRSLALLSLLIACNGTGKGVDSGTTAEDLDNDGYSVAEGDCNDNDADVHPGADEVQGDGVDQNCDPGDDLEDADGDGYLSDSDCNDGDVNIHPGATEICNEIDDNCDGATDEGVQKLAYEDADGDGVGSDAQVVTYCDTPPEGFVTTQGDCDKTDPQTYPGAAELCDSKDNNCDGTVDENAPADRTWYLDVDQDGYGDPGQELAACQGPSGYTLQTGDCNDGDAAIHPGAPEDCDLVDRDCDGQSQNNPVDGTYYYPDLDLDGYGDTSAGQPFCEPPPDLVLNGGDCNDSDPMVAPNHQEYCDGVDNNCDGAVDEAGAAGESIWYVDADGDSFGDSASYTSSCNVPVGYVGDASDCDDTDPAVGGAEAWYTDADGDGFGDIYSEIYTCTAPSGGMQVGGDCDDGDFAVNPTAVEVCDRIDNNCDGVDDEATAVDASTWYQDLDGDSFGDYYSTQIACFVPTGFVGDSTDCDDGDVSVYPTAPEFCDGIDNNCDGQIDEDTALDVGYWYADTDNDAYGDPNAEVVTCYQPAGYVADSGDCDDSAITINPLATEICDGLDNDCDADVDESGSLGESTWYRDSDGDTYGDPGLSRDACTAPIHYVADATDCDDGDALSNPGASEIADAADNDCDGWIDEDFVNAGDLILTEVARQPRFGGTSVVSDGQWFEVYNAGSSTIYLDNWYIERDSTAVGTDQFYVNPAAGLSIAPGDFLVFCNTDTYDSFNDLNSVLACDYVWSDSTQSATASGTYFDNTFNLQVDEDTLSFYVQGDSTTGTLVDTVSWYYDSVHGQWPRTATYSMQLNPKALTGTANDSISNWCLPKTSSVWYLNGTTKEYGSPGSAANCQ